MRTLVAIIAASLGAVQDRPLNAPPEGFTALFNGKDLAGWKSDEEASKHWVVKDGVLEYDGKGKSLATEKDYGDFELWVDWKIQPKGDSGIYLRGAPQVQIWDNAAGSGGLWNNKANKDPITKADNPPGQWNSFKIRLVGEKVTVHLNGKLVVDDVVMETLKGKKTGPLLLQHHGNPLAFRNIFIKPL